MRGGPGVTYMTGDAYDTSLGAKTLPPGMNYMNPYHHMALVNAPGFYTKAPKHLMPGVDEEEEEEMSTEDKDREENTAMIDLT